MGLKSGSQGSGLDDDDDESADERVESTPTDDRRSEPDQTPSQDRTPVSEGESDDRPSSNDESESYPYKLRRANVNDGRQQVPFFLRDHVLDAEQELKNDLEERLGETVYKSDYREAAMLHAQRNPKDIAKILREWGYDL